VSQIGEGAPGDAVPAITEASTAVSTSVDALVQALAVECDSGD
jgi:hypothetical protein